VPISCCSDYHTTEINNDIAYDLCWIEASTPSYSPNMAIRQRLTLTSSVTCVESRPGPRRTVQKSGCSSAED
jgi:urease beta subunit